MTPRRSPTKLWVPLALGCALATFACKGQTPAPAADAAANATMTAPAPTAPAADTAVNAPADAAAVSASDAAAPTADGAATTADAAAHPDAEAASPTVVRLVDAGAEPRRALRYGAKVGLEQVANLRMEIGLALTASGQKMPTALPKTKMSLDAKVTAVSPNGDTTFDLAITDADLADGAGAATTRAGEKLTEVVRGLKGAKGEKVASARGVSQRFHLSEGADAMASAAMKPIEQGFERAIDHMTVPFPEEPIGVGAKWEVTQKVIEAAMTLDETTTFEVVSIKDDVVSLKLTIALAAPAGTHETTLSNGTKASVKSVSGGGGGTMDVDLGKVLPTALKADNHVEMSLELEAANGPRPLDVEMKLSLEATSP